MKCYNCDASIAKQFVVKCVVEEREVFICTECVINQYWQCQWCEIYCLEANMSKEYRGLRLCKPCFKKAKVCTNCENVVNVDVTKVFEGASFCCECFRQLFANCYECGSLLRRIETVRVRDNFYCPEHAPPQFDLRLQHNPHIELPNRPPKESKTTIVGKVFFGIELECVSNSYNGDKVHENFPHWGWTRDGSIEFCDDYPFPVEFLSPILYGDEGLCETIAFVNHVAPFVTTNASCGLHIHVNAKDMTPKDACNVAIAWKHIEQDIFKAMPKNRRESRHCQTLAYNFESLQRVNTRVEFARLIYNNSSINDDYIDDIARSKYNDVRYRTLNLHSYFHKGTIEFRIHQATLSPEKIERWTEITTKLAECGRKNVVKNRNEVLGYFRPETVDYIQKRQKLFAR